MPNVSLTNEAERQQQLRWTLWVWFACGTLALALFPALRQHNPTFGWLPFWCVLAPLIDLAIVERLRLLSMSRALLARARQRRRRSARQALRRHMPHRRARARPLLAALLSR